MKPQEKLPFVPFTALDRIFERVLDFFNELNGTDFKGDPAAIDHHLASLTVLQHRVAAAFWLFGDSTRARHLGFPEQHALQEALLTDCAGDMPTSFVGCFTVEDETIYEERMALCQLQAEVEFRHVIARRFGLRATLKSVCPSRTVNSGSPEDPETLKDM